MLLTSYEKLMPRYLNSSAVIYHASLQYRPTCRLLFRGVVTGWYIGTIYTLPKPGQSLRPRPVTARSHLTKTTVYGNELLF